MIWNELRALWREPSPARPASPPWIDRGLATLLTPIAVAEGVLVGDGSSRALAVALGVGTVSALWFRRSHPLRAILLVFGGAVVATLVESALGLEPVSLHVSAVALVLPYSLVRWGTGPGIVAGSCAVAAAFGAATLGGEMSDLGDAVGGAVALVLPAALGAAVRFRAETHLRELEHVRLREREQLARELHDTVAHHASAIVIQAQAGQAVAARRPDAAVEALARIEEAATEALAELRVMVGALREGEGERAPRAGVADLERLAETSDLVRLERAGDLDTLTPAVDAAIYRLPQESITNALRHARNPREIRVRVEARAADVRLTVVDDGERSSPDSGAGFGLVGMAERVAVLRGSLEFGPNPERGWSVVATLPREGGAR